MLEELIYEYLHERVRRGELSTLTARNHTTTLRQFAASYGNRPVRNLGRRAVERWLESCENLSPGTRRSRFSMVRCFGRWLVERGHVRRDPCYGMKPPRKPRSVPRALRHEDVEKVILSAPDQRARLVAVLMVQEGLRCSEVAQLETGDLDLRERWMRVVGKGGHQRVLPITDETLRELLVYLGQFPASGGPLIRSYQYPAKPLSPVTIGSMMRRMMYDAGVKQRPRDGVSGHALRHTAATDMLRAGAHIRDVQAALGHSQLSVTETYLPLLVSTLDEAMAGRSYT